MGTHTRKGIQLIKEERKRGREEERERRHLGDVGLEATQVSPQDEEQNLSPADTPHEDHQWAWETSVFHVRPLLMDAIPVQDSFLNIISSDFKMF